MLGELISAGASLLGGVLGRSSAEKTAKENIAAQKDFAQHGVQWKVEDAKAAGVSPIYALGAPTSSFSNVTGDTSLGPAVADAGQHIGRAINATSDQSQRLDAYTQASQVLDLKKRGLENDLLASQIAQINQTLTPPFPAPGNRYLIEGQSGSGLVRDKALGRTMSAPENPTQEPAATSDIGFARTPRGWAPQPSKDAMEHMSNDFLGMLAWNLRNRLVPSVGMGYNPPPVTLPSGKQWFYNPVNQAYEPVDQRAFGDWFYGFRRGTRLNQ